MTHHGKTSSELEREVEAQRRRLDDRVTEIQQRLSPGQMVDEFVSYARSSGGGEFLNNLSRSVQNNPLPIALTAVGLAWLMMRPSNGTTAVASEPDWDGATAYNGPPPLDDIGREPLPVARIAGDTVRRVQQITDESGKRYSEFTDDAGAKFKALTDDLGNRAGHFTDEAGQTYRGFIDEAGYQVGSFVDEAGARLADAQGWAAHNWQQAGDRLKDMQQGVAARAASLKQQATSASSQLQSNAGAMGDQLNRLLHEQPLIGGALAFAVGAAIAAVLPRTPQEDQLVGEAADKLKRQGGKLAGDAYSRGKQQVADAFGQVQQEAGAVYSSVKEDVANGARSVH